LTTVPDLSQDTEALEALFDNAPDGIMVERFDPPLPAIVGNNETAEYRGRTIISYTNQVFLDLLQRAGFARDIALDETSLQTLLDEVFDEPFKGRWQGRTQQIIDNMQLINHYVNSDDDDASLMMSTTPITQHGLITGCWTRVTDATPAVDLEIKERHATKQIDAFVRTENAPIVCLRFETPQPPTLLVRELGAAYYNATVTHVTDAAAELFQSSPASLLGQKVKALDNTQINRLIDNSFPTHAADDTLNLGETKALVITVDVDVDEGQKQVYRVNPTFVSDEDQFLEAWIRVEDVTLAELRASEQRKMEKTRALAMSAASLQPFEAKWVNGQLRLEGPGWENLGLEELPKDIDSWKELLNPNNLNIPEEQMADVFSGKSNKLNFILRLTTKTGEERHIEVWGLVSPEGKDTDHRTTIGLLRDVTQNEKLRARLREKKTLEGLGVLAGGIAHDFNNLLMSVLGYAELMEADLVEASKENSTQLQQSSLQNIDEIRTAALRASELCTSLLAYAGQHLVEKTTLDLSEFVRSTAELVEVTIAKRVPLVLNLDNKIPISADKGQLTRVIINLVNNAADAMEGRNGAVHLSVSTMMLSDQERALLRDQLKFPDERVACITVRDDGAGMSRETQQRIYEPFFTTKEEGRGLGLAAVHGIVKNHGGGILLQSTEGKGTEFKICLPLLERPHTSEHPVIEPPKQKLTQPRVLVVDDEAGVRTIAAEMLRHLDCEVAEADSAETALGLLGKQEFDYALLDITMPVMSGTELAELLLERLPKLKVVLCSGYTDKDLPEALLARCAFIHKPFTLQEVSNTLELESAAHEEASPA